MTMGNQLGQKIVKLWGASRWQQALGDVSHALAPERLGPSLTGRIFWRAGTGEKVVGLSFDDGPNAVFTPALLNVLAEFSVVATFFLIGRNVKKFPELTRQMSLAGHDIGNHTFNHRMMPLLAKAALEDEIDRTHAAISEATGHEPHFLRPPMGLFTRRTVDVAVARGYLTVIGDVYPRDPNLPGTERIVRRVLARTRPGSFIILHDGGNSPQLDRSQTVDSVRQIIPRLQDQGYRFLTLSQLLELDPSCTRRMETWNGFVVAPSGAEE